MKLNIINTPFLIAVILALFLPLSMTSCDWEYENEYDFRNELRDTHPYSEIIEIDLGNWSYQVNDTIKDEVWIYIGSKTKSQVEKHCVNCKED
jgi:hypothetical protein